MPVVGGGDAGTVCFLATDEARSGAGQKPRKRLSDFVAKKLESLISSGEYPIGTKLPSEADLAQQLGVGRSSMREAVRTLQAAGYLKSTHGIGVFVINDRPRTILGLLISRCWVGTR